MEQEKYSYTKRIAQAQARASESTSNDSKDDDETISEEEYNAGAEETEEDDDDEEEEEESPLKMQRVIASRRETRSEWAKICEKMNTHEIDYGSRWEQPWRIDEKVEERFLIKWNDLGYMHCSWETEKDLLTCIDGGKKYLSIFLRKSFNGYLFGPEIRLDGDYFDPSYTQIERIIQIVTPTSTDWENQNKIGNKNNDCYTNKNNKHIKKNNNDNSMTTDVHDTKLNIVTDKDHPDFNNAKGRQFLIKWCNLSYADSTNEFERDLIINDIEYEDQLKEFIQRSRKPKIAEVRRGMKLGAKEFDSLNEIFVTSCNCDEKTKDKKATIYQQKLEKKVYKNGGKLRDYQAEGVTWFLSNYIKQRGSILADEMGLGKTVQVVSFINILATKLYRRGPYLIVAPLSTLMHWQREFSSWTDLNVFVYHGTANDRRLMREYEIPFECDRPTTKNKCNDGMMRKQIPNSIYLRKCHGAKNRNSLPKSSSLLWMAQIIITTPEILCADDYIELTCLPWEVVVIDEAHRLKNHESKLANNIRDSRFQFKHKVLLSGTPIQNNIKEFWTLLNFIAPAEFNNVVKFGDKFDNMKSKEIVDELTVLIQDYILRRLKEDVESSVPPKQETIVEVELTILQKQYYRALYEKNVKFLCKNKKNPLDGPSLNNLSMQLRKCCNHLFLLNGVEEELRSKENKEIEKENLHHSQHQVKEALTNDGEQKQTKEINPSTIATLNNKTYDFNEGDFLVNGSGKLILLDKLLPKLKKNKHRVLIFSQFKIMLNILEDFLNLRGFTYERIDGSIKGRIRQQAIDRFQKAPTAASSSTCSGKDPPFVMILSTRAGGVGINLTAADTCIIFDSDWNPKNDIQAQARCHRIGQTKNVKVYRLLSRKTYEMQMFHMSSLKLGLDQVVLHGFENKKSNAAMTKEEVERLLKHGAYSIFNEEKEGNAENESNNFKQLDIDSILERHSRVVIDDENNKNGDHGKSKKFSSTFSKARFTSTATTSTNHQASNQRIAQEDVDIQDPEFWKKIVGEEALKQAAMVHTENLPTKRRKRNVKTYSEDAIANRQSSDESHNGAIEDKSDTDDDLISDKILNNNRGKSNASSLQKQPNASATDRNILSATNNTSRLSQLFASQGNKSEEDCMKDYRAYIDGNLPQSYLNANIVNGGAAANYDKGLSQLSQLYQHKQSSPPEVFDLTKDEDQINESTLIGNNRLPLSESFRLQQQKSQQPLSRILPQTSLHPNYAETYYNANMLGYAMNETAQMVNNRSTQSQATNESTKNRPSVDQIFAQPSTYYNPSPMYLNASPGMMYTPYVFQSGNDGRSEFSEQGLPISQPFYNGFSYMQQPHQPYVYSNLAQTSYNASGNTDNQEGLQRNTNDRNYMQS